jgi:hypothetical protein
MAAKGIFEFDEELEEIDEIFLDVFLREIEKMEGKEILILMIVNSVGVS